MDAEFNGDSLYNESISAAVLAMPYDAIQIQGINNQQPSYIISTNGTMVSARNTLTENIEFEGNEPGSVINSAIDATHSGIIRISEGDYNFLNPIRPKSNISIIGEDIDNTVLNPQRAMSLIVNAHPNDPVLGIEDRNIVLGNFTINYEGVGGGDAINLVSVEKSRIFQVRIENISWSSDAIDLDACNDIFVESTDFLNIGGSAVHVSDSFTGWKSENKKGSNNITVVDAHASNVGKERKVAAFNAFARDTAISGTNNITFTKILVENSYSGVDFAKFGSGYKVIDATIVDSLSRGITIRGMNNMITNATIFDTGSHGITVINSQETTIQNSSILKSNGNNIAITDSTDTHVMNVNLGETKNGEHLHILLKNTMHDLIDGITILSK